MTVIIYVLEKPAGMRVLATFTLTGNLARVQVPCDLRTMNRLVHEVLTTRGVTPEDGIHFLWALLKNYPERDATIYGAPTAICAA